MSMADADQDTRCILGAAIIVLSNNDHEVYLQSPSEFIICEMRNIHNLR